MNNDLMAGGHDNGLATPDDFRKAAETNLEPPERVRLPKLGKYVLLRRPRPMWFLTHSPYQVPQTLAAVALNGESTPTKPTTADALASVQWTITLIREVMVQPRVAAGPIAGPGEISTDLIEMEDIHFIVAWATGMVGGAGEDLATFRNGRLSNSSANSENGRDVELPAE